MGGSTNLYLHLLAIAREAGVPLTIEHIQSVGEERVPLIANLQPAGPYAMISLHQIVRRAGCHEDPARCRIPAR